MKYQRTHNGWWWVPIGSDEESLTELEWRWVWIDDEYFHYLHGATSEGAD